MHINASTCTCIDCVLDATLEEKATLLDLLAMSTETPLHMRRALPACARTLRRALDHGASAQYKKDLLDQFEYMFENFTESVACHKTKTQQLSLN